MSVRQNGVIIAGSGSGSVDVDNSTITTNAMDEIQAVATINANTAAGATNPVYDWVGTLAEHQAQNIETLHPDWICYITDDVSGGTSVYTKSEVDNGFVALTGDQTITGTKTFKDSSSKYALQTESQVIDDNVNPGVDTYSNFINMLDKNGVLCGRILLGKNTLGENSVIIQAWKGGNNYILGIGSNGGSVAPTPSSSTDNSTAIATTAWVNNNGCAVVAYQLPTSGNSQWFVKYSNGLVIQGGEATSKAVTFPVAMANTYYRHIINSIYNNSGGAGYFELGALNAKTTTGMTKAGNAQQYEWVVFGQYA